MEEQFIILDYLEKDKQQQKDYFLFVIYFHL